MLPPGLHGMLENDHGDDDKTKRPTPDHVAKHLAVETARSGFDLVKNIHDLKKALSPGAGAAPEIVGSVLEDLKTLAGDTAMSLLGPLGAAFGVVMRVRRIVQDAKFRAQAQLYELTTNVRGELLEAVDDDSDNIGVRLRHKIKASIGRLKGTKSEKDDPLETKRQALLKTIELLGDLDASAARKEEEIREVATLPKELQEAEISEVMKTVNEGLETAKEALAEIPAAKLHTDEIIDTNNADVHEAVAAMISTTVEPSGSGTALELQYLHQKKSADVYSHESLLTKMVLKRFPALSQPFKPSAEFKKIHRWPSGKYMYEQDDIVVLNGKVKAGDYTIECQNLLVLNGYQRLTPSFRNNGLENGLPTIIVTSSQGTLTCVNNGIWNWRQAGSKESSDQYPDDDGDHDFIAGILRGACEALANSGT